MVHAELNAFIAAWKLRSRLALWSPFWELIDLRGAIGLLLPCAGQVCWGHMGPIWTGGGEEVDLERSIIA